jgi:hypothetical protein
MSTLLLSIAKTGRYFLRYRRGPLVPDDRRRSEPPERGVACKPKLERRTALAARLGQLIGSTTRTPIHPDIRIKQRASAHVHI